MATLEYIKTPKERLEMTREEREQRARRWARGPWYVKTQIVDVKDLSEVSFIDLKIDVYAIVEITVVHEEVYMDDALLSRFDDKESIFKAFKNLNRKIFDEECLEDMQRCVLSIK